MIFKLLTKPRVLDFERTYDAPASRVWQAWTRADLLRSWWGPDKTHVPECEIDLRIGGRIHVVMEAGAEMGKYAGTRWPMEGIFTDIEPVERLRYEARSWTEGEEEGTTIRHTNEVTLRQTDGGTLVRLEVAITEIGPKAKMAAFGMKWGYRQQLDKLARLVADPSSADH